MATPQDKRQQGITSGEAVTGFDSKKQNVTADESTVYEIDNEYISLIAAAASQAGEISSATRPSTYRIESKNIITVTHSIEDESFTIWHINLSPAAKEAQSSDEITQASKSKKISPWFTLSKTNVKNFQPTGQYPLKALPAHLSVPRSENGDPNIHVVVSIKSGTGVAPEYFQNILEPLLKGIGLDSNSYKKLDTSSTESVHDFASDVLLKRADRGEEQTVMLLSGDGGIVDLLNGLLEDKIKSKFVLFSAFIQSNYLTF